MGAEEEAAPIQAGAHRSEGVGMSDDKRAWKWAPGMLDTWGRRMVEDGAGGLQRVNPYNPPDNAVDESDPDTTDAATLGALLGQVREAWGLPYAHAFAYHYSIGEKDPDTGERPIIIGWRVEPGPYTEEHGRWEKIPATLGRGPTEWDALVAALEAAP